MLHCMHHHHHIHFCWGWVGKGERAYSVRLLFLSFFPLCAPTNFGEICPAPAPHILICEFNVSEMKQPLPASICCCFSSLPSFSSCTSSEESVGGPIAGWSEEGEACTLEPPPPPSERGISLSPPRPSTQEYHHYLPTPTPPPPLSFYLGA